MLGATVRRHRDLRDRLLAAGETVIAGPGLPALRARSLAEEVGCSVGAIYGVFPDLNTLVLEVNGRTLEAIDATLAAAGTGTGPGEHLARLADAYLGYAHDNRRRWEALFQHRMADGQDLPDWFTARQAAAFSHIEQPLAALRPDLGGEARAVLARTLFSAVHGMVALGLDATVVALDVAALREQMRIVVRALAAGLASGVEVRA